MYHKDFHIHSSASADADYSVDELLQRAKNLGVREMAITDHDSIDAVKTFMTKAEDYGIQAHSGIEISTQIDGVPFHMTAYDFDVNDPLYTQIKEDHRKESQASTWKAAELFFEHVQLPFPKQELDKISKDGVLIPEDIGEMLMNDENYRHYPWLKPFLEGDRSDNPYVNFYWDFFSYGKPAYVPTSLPDARVMIEKVHQSNGLAVIAHPGVNFKDRDDLIEALIQEGIDGIEVFSSYHSDEQRTHYQNLAQKHGLLITCGSDFHGKNKPSIEIGMMDIPDDVCVGIEKTMK